MRQHPQPRHISELRLPCCNWVVQVEVPLSSVLVTTSRCGILQSLSAACHSAVDGQRENLASCCLRACKHKNLQTCSDTYITMKLPCECERCTWIIVCRLLYLGAELALSSV
jgi:hypothetical protein